MARTALCAYVSDAKGAECAFHVARSSLGEYDLFAVAFPRNAIGAKSAVSALSAAHGVPVHALPLSGVAPANPVDACIRAVTPLLQDGDVAVVISGRVCFSARGAISNLTRYLFKRPHEAGAYACVVGSDRSLYIHQVMSLEPSWLLLDWDSAYIDSYDIQSWSPALARAVHERFLDSLADDASASGWSFGEYTPSPSERICTEVVAVRIAPDCLGHFGSVPSLGMRRSYPRWRTCGHAVFASVGERKELGDLITRYLKTASPPLPSSTHMALVEGLETEVREHELTYLVSTCASYEQHEAVQLVRLLVAGCGVNPKNILVVSGGNESPGESEMEGVRLWRVPHNSYDHNALIEATRRGVAGTMFLLHDTTRPGADFHRSVLRQRVERGHTAMVQGGWFNMGLFTAEYLAANSQYIQSLENLSKFQAVLSEQMYPRFAGGAYIQGFEGIQYHGHRVVAGRPRCVTYHPELDLYKHQTYFLKAACTQDLLSRHRTDPRDALAKMRLK
jgi:hypothetical protein